MQRALQSRAPTVARDLHEHTSLAARGVLSAIAVPLLHEGAILGVLVVGAAQADAFVDADVALFGELGEVLAYGIANLRERSAHRLAEVASRDNERRFRAIFEQAAMGIARVNSVTGRFLEVNHQYCAITGYSEQEMLALSFQRVTHPDDLQADLDNMRRLRDGELKAFHMEKRYLHKDGPTVWVNLTCVPLWEKSGAADMQHLAMVEDITERKRADEALREREQRLSRVYEAVGDVIFDLEVEPGDLSPLRLRQPRVLARHRPARGGGRRQARGRGHPRGVPPPGARTVPARHRGAVHRPLGGDERVPHGAAHRRGQRRAGARRGGALHAPRRLGPRHYGAQSSIRENSASCTPTSRDMRRTWSTAWPSAPPSWRWPRTPRSRPID